MARVKKVRLEDEMQLEETLEEHREFLDGGVEELEEEVILAAEDHLVSDFSVAELERRHQVIPGRHSHRTPLLTLSTPPNQWEALVAEGDD